MSELDVHELTVDEAVRAFIDFYNGQVRKRPAQSIRIIHGYGSTGQGGKIRKQIRSLLRESEGYLDWSAGEDSERNPGTTIVNPRKPIPVMVDRLAGEILAFCSTPKTVARIAGEFRRLTPREIKDAIHQLVRRGLLKEIHKAGRANYVRSG
jgi:hypothetical protein